MSMSPEPTYTDRVKEKVDRFIDMVSPEDVPEGRRAELREAILTIVDEAVRDAILITAKFFELSDENRELLKLLAAKDSTPH